MKPEPSDDAIYYDVEVTVTFNFQVEADDDMMAEDIASYEWEDNIFRGSIDRITVDAIEEDEDEEDDSDDN